MNKVLMFPAKSGEKTKRRRGGGGAAPPVDSDALSKAVVEKNREFAIILMGGRSFILREFHHPTLHQPTQDFLTPSAFRDWLATERFVDPETERWSGLGDLWIKHKARRWYHGMTFNPEGAPENWYNLWRGFVVDPAPAEADYRDHVRHFATLYDHVLKNVAGGDVDLARWVWGWFAHMIQKPTERLGTALVLQGRQGSGKSALGDAIGSLLGQHYTMIDDPRHLVGNFNAHLTSCLLLQADEAVWAGDKAAAGKLRSLITSRKGLTERKNIDAEQTRNLVRLLMTSEEDWVVPASMEERRFAVISIGTGKMQDRDYFGRLFAELDDGGRPHLLAYLMAFPLASVDLGTLPRTEALFEQKAATFDPEVDWWYDCLRRGAVLLRQRKWPDTVPASGLYESYLSFAERLKVRRPMSNARLGIKLRKLVPTEYGFSAGKVRVEKDERGPDGEPILNHDGSIPTERVNGYVLPGLNACRKHFAALVRYDRIDWGDTEIGPGPKEIGDDEVPF